ncbi:MAG TPA: hypothetical protein VJT85_00085 [Gemmatimonadaceae bacterium]|nr:hypothetical protein [Gemmatimonadaceae bacterium]
MSDDKLRDAIEAAAKCNGRADNAFGVGVTGEGTIVLLRPPMPLQTFTKSRALELAAWIVTLANDEEAWQRALSAVQR